MKHQPNAGMQSQESYTKMKHPKQTNQQKHQKAQLETTGKWFLLVNASSDTGITEYTF